MPDADGITSRRLRWVGALLALVGLAALVAQVFDVLAMPYFLMFFGVPSVLALFVMAAYAKKIQAHVFLNALVVGLAGGLLGTFAYDAVRFLVYNSGLFNFDGFAAIYIFGGWIVGSEPTTSAAAVAGWTYHFWNGISFGVFYLLIFGRRHWMFGVTYGVVIELCMLGLFPFFLAGTDRVDFIALSLIGHLVYGLVLGLVAQKYGRNWSDSPAVVAT